jgi:hypothetical protein
VITNNFEVRFAASRHDCTINAMDFNLITHELLYHFGEERALAD